MYDSILRVVFWICRRGLEKCGFSVLALALHSYM